MSVWTLIDYCRSTHCVSAFDEKQDDKRKEISNRPIFAKASTSKTAIASSPTKTAGVRLDEMKKTLVQSAYRKRASEATKIDQRLLSSPLVRKKRKLTESPLPSASHSNGLRGEQTVSSADTSEHSSKSCSPKTSLGVLANAYGSDSDASS
jgi:hypothetical protein